MARLRLRLPSLPTLPSSLATSWRLPRLTQRLTPRLTPPPRWPRLPLPITTAAVLALVLVPGLILSRWNRPRAAGLEQVLGAASLLQSFPASPERPVPQLWRERLGDDRARRLWARQRTLWWQLWASRGEAAPYLVLPSQALGGPNATLPPQALRVGDLIVVAESPIARQQLRSSLRPLQRRSQGLLQRCHQRLQEPQAVFWQADALGTLLGPVAPLLERYQVGCLSLALEGQALRWQGEAGPAALLAVGTGAAPASPPAPPAPRPTTVAAYVPSRPPLGRDQLLELEGSSLDQLLAGLLSRQMIRDPLAARYGLEGDRLDRLRRTPFRLLLLPQAQGPFQATLELIIPLGSERALWAAVLEKVRTSLLEQALLPSDPALSRLPAAPGSPPAAATGTLPAATPGSAPPGASSLPPAAALSAGSAGSPGGRAPSGSPSPPTTPSAGSSAASGTSLWWRADGSLVGGWRWLDRSGSEPQLLLFLGPPPAEDTPGASRSPDRPGQRSLAAGPASASRSPLAAPQLRREADGTERLRLSARPAALQSLGLLGGALPGLVRQADQLWLSSESPRQPAGRQMSAQGTGEPLGISLLTGRLQLGR